MFTRLAARSPLISHPAAMNVCKARNVCNASHAPTRVFSKGWGSGRSRPRTIGTSKSEEMLLDAIHQPTIEQKLQLLASAVKQGADINQKIDRNKIECNRKSLLHQVSYFNQFEEEFVPLTEALFSLGAKVDYTEYHEGSPLHDVLYFVGSTSKKVNAIWLYTFLGGVNINHSNENLSTPLDYAHYFDSNKQDRDKIVHALCLRGAKHGSGPYSPSSYEF